ncbi:MAG: sigma-70 family RNA polymerase sigma factor [Sphingobacteriaceae bacterium]|nr:sigma-70 family RNA polymerase sigma factor [Sphingobacteriaceae bacterium]
MTKINQLPELWEASKAGDAKAYSALHSELYPKLFNYALKIVKDDQVADDLLQEVFLKFWSKRNQIGVINNISSYFYQSTRFIVINYLRDIKNQQLKLDQMPEPDIQFSSEEIIMERESSRQLKYVIQTLLNSLPARQREIVYLRFYEECSYEQIVQITGIRYQSVVNHIYRAVQTMREGFECNNNKMVIAS